MGLMSLIYVGVVHGTKLRMDHVVMGLPGWYLQDSCIIVYNCFLDSMIFIVCGFYNIVKPPKISTVGGELC